jgi:hypothetical protein
MRPELSRTVPLLSQCRWSGQRHPHRIEAELISALAMGTNLDVAAADQSRPSATRAVKLIHPMRRIFIPHLGKMGFAYFSPSEDEGAHTSRGTAPPRVAAPVTARALFGPSCPSPGKRLLELPWPAGARISWGWDTEYKVLGFSESAAIVGSCSRSTCTSAPSRRRRRSVTSSLSLSPKRSGSDLTPTGRLRHGATLIRAALRVEVFWVVVVRAARDRHAARRGCAASAAACSKGR